MEKLDARIQLSSLNQHLPTEELVEYTRQHSLLLEALKNRDQEGIETMLQSHILHYFHEG